MAQISEQTPSEKRAVLQRALAFPDDENSKIIISKAQERGWLTSDPGIAQQVLDIGKKAVAPAVAATRGVQRAFTGLIPEGQELAEAATTFPVIRGAELAAKGVQKLRGEPAAPLTTFADVLSQQRGLTKELEEKAPGVERGAEFGVMAAEVLPAATRLIARGATKAGGGLIRKLNELKTKRLTKSMLKRVKGKAADDFIIEAITERPDEVRRLLDQGDLSTQELAQKTRNFIDAKQTELGEKVQKFRNLAASDNAPTIQISEGLVPGPGGITMVQKNPLLDQVRSIKGRATLEGKNLLPGDINRKLDILESLLSKNTISPAETLKATDAIDDVIDWGAKEGSNIVRNAEGSLTSIRNTLKNKIRDKYPDWYAADEAFANYKEASKEIKNKLDSLGAENFVKNIMNVGKGETRDQLIKLLNLAEDAVPGELQAGERFLNELANIKAAQGIRAFDVGAADPIADNVRSIVSKYRSAGGLLGTAVGTKVGGFPGAGVGAVVGGFAGDVLGRKMADPRRILDAASKAKGLAPEARALAKDLMPIAVKYGTDGVNAMLNLIPAARAAQELVEFTGGKE